MDLLEYQGKQLFKKHGVPVPDGRPASTVDEAVEAAEDLGYPVVVKAQVLIGGRGKGNGIKLAKDRAEIEEHANAILGMDIRGFTVHELYIEKASDIAEEYYASVIFDRSARKPMLMLTKHGGMDVEEVADQHPESIVKVHVDPLIGFQDFHGRELAFGADIADDVIRPVGAMLGKLYETFVAEDAMLVEGNPLLVTGDRQVVALFAEVRVGRHSLNPLLVTGDRQVVALDAKVTVDGNSLYLHPDTASLRNVAAGDPQEQMATE